MPGTFAAHTSTATVNPFHYPSFEVVACRIEHYGQATSEGGA